MQMHRVHLRFHLLQLLFRRPWVRVTLGPSSFSLRIKIDCRRRRWTPMLWLKSLSPLTPPQMSPDPLRMEGRCDLPRWRLRGSNGQLKVLIALTTNSNSLCIYFFLVQSRSVSFLFVSLLFVASCVYITIVSPVHASQSVDPVHCVYSIIPWLADAFVLHVLLVLSCYSLIASYM
jgi:hypothetical protein